MPADGPLPQIQCRWRSVPGPLRKHKRCTVGGPAPRLVNIGRALNRFRTSNIGGVPVLAVDAMELVCPARHSLAAKVDRCITYIVEVFSGKNIYRRHTICQQYDC